VTKYLGGIEAEAQRQVEHDAGLARVEDSGGDEPGIKQADLAAGIAVGAVQARTRTGT